MSPSPFLHELGEQNVRMLGQKPASFESVSEGSRDTEGNPLAKKWHVGLGVYHDDYGHGQIVKAGLSEEGEYVISVSFENGGIKRFLPKYQSSALMVEENV
jgi:DNA helicase-2/ATP-dependent DNA helicase PcrA